MQEAVICHISKAIGSARDETLDWFFISSSLPRMYRFSIILL
jgi:hypothetical protein